jgi:serine/threonine protein kinase
MSKLLSEGGFGCVFHPQIGCNGKPTNDEKVVTKVQIRDFNSENEALVGSLIQTIPVYTMFFLPAINSCPINVRSIESNIISECSIITDADDTKRFIALDIPYIDSVDFVETLKNGSAKQAIMTLAETYRYILNAIEKLHTISVAHLDLKLGNIVYKRKTSLPRIIDFGISVPIEEVNDENMTDYFYSYEPTYYIWSPEVNLLNYLCHRTSNPLTNNDIERIAAEIVDGNKGFESRNDVFKDNYFRELIAAFGKYQGMQINEAKKKLLQTWKSWDLYSLNVMYLRILDSLFPDLKDNSFVSKMRNVFDKGVSANFENRSDPGQLAESFMDIFFMDSDIDTYLATANAYKMNSDTITKSLSIEEDTKPSK